ncbi:MAG: hypothetical protein HOK94_02150 [Candidatus Marinimicrobia bacterium]|nr:hypothetical protein [Candidatus Neomarinimicrobiota bacterium]MBT3839058.1 hypothetical protein [Candidatus Neomarinimicrobiota bacterium]MBT4283598.1 hypothetical protein [Candidatus Neomarinimicrobiota bacterium]MBT5363176.1 hypothetical protein [Candidatus Neomarinimicrobiota bacterium]MBT5460431.1 hypothetical protein [Candidatus Neomarinimicrobiota bacterium]
MLISISYSQSGIKTSLDCDQCHSPGQWLPLSSNMSFQHNITFFPLNGQHIQTDCIQCHNGQTVEIRHQFSNTETNCNGCHLDIHSGSFGDDCTLCHTPNSWNHMNQWIGHEFTNFPLVGAHKRIECSSCHSTPLAEIIMSDCISCHLAEYNFVLSSGNHPDNEYCEQCHNTRTFLTIDQGRHDIMFFPINSGDHKGEWSSCTAECHTNPTDYTDFSCGLNGVCHDHRQSEMDDEHDDEPGYYYESTSCYSCHPNGEKDD